MVDLSLYAFLPFNFLVFPYFYIRIYVFNYYHKANFIHGGSYALELLRESIDGVSPKRLIAYFALVHFLKSLSVLERKKRFDELGQMVPVYCFALRFADDIIEYSSVNDVKLVKAAQRWMADGSNAGAVKIAASWLLNHHVSPNAQRGTWTLQSYLATVIMKNALAGLPLESYNSTIK